MTSTGQNRYECHYSYLKKTPANYVIRMIVFLLVLYFHKQSFCNEYDFHRLTYFRLRYSHFCIPVSLLTLLLVYCAQFLYAILFPSIFSILPRVRVLIRRFRCCCCLGLFSSPGDFLHPISLFHRRLLSLPFNLCFVAKKKFSNTLSAKYLIENGKLDQKIA